MNYVGADGGIVIVNSSAAAAKSMKPQKTGNLGYKDIYADSRAVYESEPGKYQTMFDEYENKLETTEVNALFNEALAGLSMKPETLKNAEQSFVRPITLAVGSLYNKLRMKTATKMPYETNTLKRAMYLQKMGLITNSTYKKIEEVLLRAFKWELEAGLLRFMHGMPVASERASSTKAQTMFAQMTEMRVEFLAANNNIDKMPALQASAEDKTGKGDSEPTIQPKDKIGKSDSDPTIQPSTSKADSNVPLFYTVKSGDTLRNIAKDVYGDENEYTRIYAANQHILKDSPDDIFTGQKLFIPQHVLPLYYTVQPGDTLQGIAVKFYGDEKFFNRLIEANRGTLQAPYKISAGQRLYIPKYELPQLYTVKSGDTLESLSKEYYGDARHSNILFEANQDVIPSTKELSPGQKIGIPIVYPS